MSRKKKKRESQISDSWLLPYADMLTLLLALFIILFASSAIDSERYERLAEIFRSQFSAGGVGIIDDGGLPMEIDTPDDDEAAQEPGTSDMDETEKQNLEEIKENIDTYIEENELGGRFHTELTGEGLMISIEDHIFFDLGSAEVKKEAEKTAKELAQLLNSDPPHEVVVSGHTDDIPINNHKYASNWELSVARALNFMSIMLENKDLDPTLFSAKGYGEYKPAVPNTSEENRQRNRRVEILILPNEPLNVENNEYQ